MCIRFMYLFILILLLSEKEQKIVRNGSRKKIVKNRTKMTHTEIKCIYRLARLGQKGASTKKPKMTHTEIKYIYELAYF